MPPQTVARLEEAGSGANFRPYSASASSRWSCTTPGWTVARFSSGETSTMLSMYFVKSSTTQPGPTAWPASEEPVPRGKIGTSWSVAVSTAAFTSATSVGQTTPAGRAW
jgi:hypothetical protein